MLGRHLALHLVKLLLQKCLKFKISVKMFSVFGLYDNEDEEQHEHAGETSVLAQMLAC